MNKRRRKKLAKKFLRSKIKDINCLFKEHIHNYTMHQNYLRAIGHKPLSQFARMAMHGSSFIKLIRDSK